MRENEQAPQPGVMQHSLSSPHPPFHNPPADPPHAADDGVDRGVGERPAARVLVEVAVVWLIG